MHEMSIAGAILDAMDAECARTPGSWVAKAAIRIGEWSGVSPDSLQFCLEALVQQDGLRRCEFEIEFRERSSELEIAYLEMEDDEPYSDGAEGPERERPDGRLAAPALP
jgi:Zn finger protein HypA/HybF involved in hydrogenase expression